MEVLASIRYQKLQQIGVGQGMNSLVFLAHDPQLDGRIAVKEIEKSRLGNSVGRFFDEAKAMFAVAHPNIVPVHYACERGVAVVESDIYQVGLLLYRAANGEPAYAAQIPSPPDLERQILRGRFPRRDEFMPHVPRRIRTIIRRALRVDPAERYHSSSEMADELARVMVTNDWVTSSPSVGALRWEAIRGERPGLLIELGCANSEFSVSVFTTRGSKRRAKGRSTFWGKFSSRAEADAHVNSVFQLLE